jgi:hypothetical protein
MKTTQRIAVSQEELERLERFDSRGAPILSVYLDLDPQRRVFLSLIVGVQEVVTV